MDLELLASRRSVAVAEEAVAVDECELVGGEVVAVLDFGTCFSDFHLDCWLSS